MSVKSNFSLPLAWYISSFFVRKNLRICCVVLQFRYSSGVIIIGAAIHCWPIFEPMT